MDDGAWLSSELPQVEAWRMRAKPRDANGSLLMAQDLGSSLRTALRSLKVDIAGTQEDGGSQEAALDPTETLERVLSSGAWADHEKDLMRAALSAPEIPLGGAGTAQ